MSKIQDGKFIDSKVKLKLFSTIERGPLKKVAAIVVHQTGASSVDITFDSYKGVANGAHFLIDKDGTIYQTARVSRVTFHVGKIRSRCLETHQCTEPEQKSAHDILFARNKSYSTRTNELERVSSNNRQSGNSSRDLARAAVTSDARPR